MYKKYLIIITSICLLTGIGYVHADFSSNDCRIIINGPDKALEEYKNDIKSQRPTLLDEKTIKQALVNLSNTCNNIIGGAESEYIFDHLIDLAFRKIDAYSDATLRYNLEPDIKGKERQDLVTKFAIPSNNTKPEQVIDAFNNYWKNDQAGTSYVTSSTCNIENTEALSLPGRYKAACEIAKCLSEKKIIATDNITNTTSAAFLSNNEICDTLVSNRYSSEISYTKLLIARVGIRTIDNVIEQYTKNYFIGNRRQSLYEQFASFNQNLSFVNRKIQEGTPVCSAK